MRARWQGGGVSGRRSARGPRRLGRLRRPVSELPASFDGETLLVGSPSTTPASAVRQACSHGRASGHVEIGFDGANNVIYIVADGFGAAHRASVLGRDEIDRKDAPSSLWTDTSAARILFTDDPWPASRDLFPDQTELPVWQAIYADLTGSAASYDEYDHIYPLDCCAECRDDEWQPMFCLCFAHDGRANGLQVEALAGILPEPPNADRRSATSGRWPG